ncbi:LacI family DNA-binding transcriptional regulator [Agromyces sp. NPDC056965]|uniref:LacI family DNA-binding transcriptional regulator n=1 Tax=Agromyces sp. NPDC056965 TaxID=3345983 RepID=UPI00363C2BF5
MAKKVTLSDVASAAGVSIATASRALGSAGRISAETRQRVLATAERLDFQPDALAKSFVTGKSATVGVLAEQAIGLYSMPVLIGAIERLSEHGIATLMYDARATSHELLAHLRQLRARRVDGLLIVGDTPDLTSLADALDFPAPMVFADVEPSGRNSSVVIAPDGHHAGLLAGRHLIGLGRRRIAHLTASAAGPAVQRRAAGMLEALAEHELPLVLGAPLHGTYSRSWGVVAAEQLLASGEPFDAIFAGDDEIAIGAYTALSRAGLRIPDDVAIVGYDNQHRPVHHDGIWLTSIEPRLHTVGSRAAEALLASIAGEQPPAVELVPGELVVGRSTIGPTLGAYEQIAP